MKSKELDNMLSNIERVKKMRDTWAKIRAEYPLACGEEGERLVVSFGTCLIGNGHFAVIAGPCAVESAEQIHQSAKAMVRFGTCALRGGAYKPRTSPYAFQGLEEEGLALLVEAGKAIGLPVVSEITDASQLSFFDEVDILQVGARNMQNYALLKALADQDKPIILKRGFSATLTELLASAEYLMTRGNTQIILCERGIRSFEPLTRNTLDLSAVPLLQQICRLPVVVDPSHGTGVASLVPAMSLAAVAAGADGLLLEVHPQPEQALSDGEQSLNFTQFGQLMADIQRLRNSLHKP
jgi:3-deoxy-7-phosphoheptulonate synthase